MRIEAEFEAQTLQARDDLHHEWIYLAGTEALKAAGKSFNDPDVPGETLAELVRRGLLELNRRYRARLADDHGRSFFDQLFDPARPAKLTFGKLADQHMSLIEEDGAINALGAKGLDRQRATIALVREIVGDDTPVDAVDYDACLHIRTILARLPANRTKLYGDLPIDQAIERAAKDGKPLLSPVTQERYLVALRDLLDLAAKKWLIPVNPAEGLRPIKRDAIASAPATSANHSRSSKSRTSSKASIMPNVPNARATATPVDLAVDKVSADYDESGVVRTRAIAVLDDKTRKKARKNTRKLIDLKFDGRLTQLITVTDSGFSAIKAARAKRGAVVVPVPK